MERDQEVFVAGCLFGFVFAGLIGWILQRMRLAWLAVNAPNRPMVVPTQRTPRGVILTAAAAFRRFLLWLLFLIVLVVIGLVLFYILVIGNPLDLLLGPA